MTMDDRLAADERDFAEAFAAARAGEVERARALVAARRGEKPGDKEWERRIDGILREPRRLLGPVLKPPRLGTTSGMGSTLLGERSRRPDDRAYVATHCIVFLGIPIFPRAAYLVRPAGSGKTTGGFYQSYEFLGRVPLSDFARRGRAIAPLAALAISAAIALGSYFATRSQEGFARRLDDVRAALRRGDEAEAARIFGTLERDARNDSEAREIAAAALARIAAPADVPKFLAGPGAAILAAVPPDLLFHYDDQPESKRLVERAAALAAAREAGGGAAARDLFAWARKVRPGWSDSKYETDVLTLVDRVCEGGPVGAELLAAAVSWHKETGKILPGGLVKKLGAALRERRYEGWEADVETYCAAADPADAKALREAK